MSFRTSELKLPLLLVVVSAMIPTAWAQSAGRSIIFSTPDNNSGSQSQSSLEPVNPQLGLHDPGQAPVQLFDFSPPFGNFASPPPPVTLLPESRNLQKLLKERQNWILMTPDEMLGVTATDKLLQSRERDALGADKNPTQLERYVQRERQMRNGPTNGWRADRLNASWDLPRDTDNANRPDFGHDNPTEAGRDSSQFSALRQNHDKPAAPRQSSIWDAPSPQTTVTTKPDPDQLAAMDRFRQLLNPSPVEASPSSADNQPFAATKPLVDPLFSRPEFIPNPVGASFLPLSSGIARPVGLSPLPDAVSGALPPSTATVRKPQPPPWLIQGPQPFVMSQPKGY